MEDIHARFEAAVARRDQVQGEVTRRLGRYEQAKARLEEIEQECRTKKVEPDNLDAVIQALEAKYVEMVEDLENQVREAEEKLKPFLEGT
jgi:chromosome segregation ATPase